MALTAADLDRDQKRALLDHLETTMGRDNYNAAVRQVGEDGVIDAFFQYAEKNKSTSSPKNESKGSWVLSVVFFICQNGWFLLGLGWPGIVLWGACWLVFLGVWVMESTADEVGTVVASILGIGILGGVGFGLWKLSPWLFGGMKSWFGWLGSHF